MVKTLSFTLQKAFKASKGILLIFLFLQVILAFSSIINTFTFKEIIDTATHNKTFLGLSIFSVIIFRLGFDILRRALEGVGWYLWGIFDARLLIFMHEEYVDKIKTLDLSTFENPYAIGLSQRAFSRIQFQFKYYLSDWINIFTISIELIATIGIFIFASPLVAVALVIANIIPIFIKSKLSAGKFNIYRADDETRRKFGYTADILQTRETLPEVKIFQAFEPLKKRLIDIYLQFTKHQLAMDRQYNLVTTVFELLPLIAVFAYSLVIAQQLLHNRISTGTFVFLFTNIFTFSGALGRLAQAIGSVNSDSHFINDIKEFFELKPHISFPVISKKEVQILQSQTQKPTIVIENLSFKYPQSNTYALKNINIEIPYGQNVALIGENGAGKTTLVKLLMRIYDPTEGSISINGVDLREMPEKTLFSIYSTLFQEFGKFHLTVKENLELAAGRKLTEEEMKRYLKFSNAWEFIKETKHQLNQQLGPEYTDGTDLSGGQWQRLAIARAYAKRAPVLILDEPTSAVDARSEMEIFDRLISEMQENTLIFISHRFSTIKDAQQIIVLDKGKVAEEGTHQELMKSAGKYHDLYNLQAQRYERV